MFQKRLPRTLLVLAITGKMCMKSLDLWVEKINFYVLFPVYCLLHSVYRS